MAVLKGLAEEWDEVGRVLYLPDAARELIRSEQTSDYDRLRAVVVRWLLLDPLASWRRLI